MAKVRFDEDYQIATRITIIQNLSYDANATHNSDFKLLNLSFGFIQPKQQDLDLSPKWNRIAPGFHILLQDPKFYSVRI